MNILDQIDEPEKLKRLTTAELVQLAKEIRAFLVESVSKTGGHFGANLGVVELTLALHRVFHSPEDKIVWDVGHQAYVHKLLTGRKEGFASLRQFGGMAGFPRRDESVHDQFGVGHASTSISAALGMAVARDLQKKDNHVIAVIGDGALTGGMAMEALNHAGHLGTNLLVVLNDNEMSISENVGAVSKYLTKLRSDPTYARAKADLEQILRRLPAIGNRLTNTLERFKDGMRNLVVPGQFFEAFGFRYLGPVDGHDLAGMIHTLEDAKRLKGPVLLHVITQKGKGYASAENAIDKWHAWPTPKGDKQTKSYSQIFAETLRDLAKDDPRIVAVSAAMLPGTGLSAFQSAFPNRCFDVGIAEQHAATFCAGLATQGMRPVFAVYSTFLQRAYDQLIHDVAIQNLPVLFAVDRAGLVGADGETHQGAFDISYARTLPNLTIMMPKDAAELRQMIHTALTLNGPCIVRYPRADTHPLVETSPIEHVPIGKAEIVREGSQVAIFALGPMVAMAETAADALLQAHGISAKVVNLRFVKPLDEALVIECGRHMPIVTVEEASTLGGAGSAILEALAAADVCTPLHRLGLPDEFIPHGGRNELLKSIGLTVDGIVQACLDVVSVQTARQSHMLVED
ncbi:1-deoxy-D-xylulose-5-phosphate synthase [Alicyclobacillus fastidiosus]|uniref:1-deoxy-D-xylulose-5-phosphate synthase n=1 Tax=Alicyclobacillus fastidiosus TaxID=392011 RepID=A0ABY6ZQC4_9BACL|nr:1-deoxy-D-xylulose-5-phosphate synthase [Alicyclobacillus fastidiosus]WAH44306.1 1-deoxy-D-xylulose-5-phosphate synthase [Alicyclobacillus fastidiosus]GMA60631.1 1-deoxy-D-xylulose-5-phosphate synthase [Alicyclobacillus fastidiosus]